MAENTRRTRSSQKNQPSTSSVAPTPALAELIQYLNSQNLFKKDILDRLSLLEAKVDTLASGGTSQVEENGRKRKLEDGKGPTSKKNDAPESAGQKQVPAQEPVPAKSFVLKHVFKRVSNMPENTRASSAAEEHFGVPWAIFIRRENDSLQLFTECRKSIGNGWIEVELNVELIGRNGASWTDSQKYKFEGSQEQKGFSLGWGWLNFMKMEDLKNDYLVNGDLTVQIHVTIIKMLGIYKDNLRLFDESMEEVSDIILIVKDQRFYVSKLFLASQSPYFKSMFLGRYKEATQSEITLAGVDPDDFQNYLEALYGEPAIDDVTVEGILQVADIFDTPLITGKCQEFLLEKSKKSNKKKLELSIRYRLEDLKKKTLDGIKTVDDVRAVVPSDPRDMDPSIMANLFVRALSTNHVIHTVS